MAGTQFLEGFVCFNLAEAPMNDNQQLLRSNFGDGRSIPFSDTCTGSITKLRASARFDPSADQFAILHVKLTGDQVVEAFKNNLLEKIIDPNGVHGWRWWGDINLAECGWALSWNVAGNLDNIRIGEDGVITILDQ